LVLVDCRREIVGEDFEEFEFFDIENTQAAARIELAVRKNIGDM